MNNISMYVIMHKDADIPKKEGYKSLLVGAAIGNNSQYAEYKDNVGDNISQKNKSYCELTGIYWVWKNDENSEIIGICHYRRFFTDNYFSMNINSCLEKEKIEKLFKKYNVVVSKIANYKTSIGKALTEAPSIRDMEAVKHAIEIVSRDYLEDYEKFIAGNEYYPYNMMIMRKDDFNGYCEWLFSILAQVEKDYGNPYTDVYRHRLFGFLSERLLYVWVNHNFKKNKIKGLKVLYTEENIIRSNLHIIVSMIKKIFFKIGRRFKL